MTGNRPSGPSDDRGQAYTLEGTVAAIVVLLAVGLVSQSSVVGPGNGSTGDQQTQLEEEIDDALVIASNTEHRPDGLSSMVGEWDGDRFEESDMEEFVLGSLLREQFDDREFRVAFGYETENGTVVREMVYETVDGEPGPAAVSTSRTVVMFEDELSHSESPLPADADVMGPVSTVVDVEVVVW